MGPPPLLFALEDHSLQLAPQEARIKCTGAYADIFANWSTVVGLDEDEV